MRVGIDIGGTFTDFVLFEEESGRFTTFKVLSTPRDPAEAVLGGLEQWREGQAGIAPPPTPPSKGLPSGSEFPPSEGGVGGGAELRLVHGSTVATNALLERKGALTALVTTAGFRDVLEI